MEYVIQTRSPYAPVGPWVDWAGGQAFDTFEEAEAAAKAAFTSSFEVYGETWRIVGDDGGPHAEPF